MPALSLKSCYPKNVNWQLVERTSPHNKEFHSPLSVAHLNSQSNNSVSEMHPEASHYHNKQSRGKQRYCVGSFYNNLSDSINVCLLNLDIDVSILIGFLFRCKWTDICHCQLSPLSVCHQFLWNRNKYTATLNKKSTV